MQPRTIYAAMTGGFGSLAQVLPVLHHLDAARFRVVFSIAHGAAHALEALGLEHVPYPQVEPPALVTPRGPLWRDLDEYWGRFGFADQAYFRRLIESRLRVLDALRPDALLTQFCPPTEVLARITKLPLISFTQSCWHPAGKDIDWWGAGGERAYPKVVPAVNAVLASHGAPEIERMQELSRGDVTILPSFPEFDPVDDEDAHFTGPMVWSSAQDIRSELDPAFYRAGRGPLVVVYTGHLTDSAGPSGQRILDGVVEALRDTHYRVVIATGLGQRLERAPSPAANIRICRWAPLSELLPACELFIHHGGHGSCMAAITHGAPSLVIPTFQEREFNARQLHALGLGDFIAPDALSGPALAREIDACVGRRPAFLAALDAWRSALARRRYDRGASAARLIEELLDRPARGRESTPAAPREEPG